MYVGICELNVFNMMQVKSYVTHASSAFDKQYVQELLVLLHNHTNKWAYDNPVDISITIRSLANLVHLQVNYLTYLVNDYR